VANRMDTLSINSLSEALSEDTSIFKLGEPISEQSVQLAAQIEHHLVAHWPAWLIDFRIGFGTLLIQYQPDMINHLALCEELAKILVEPHASTDSKIESLVRIPTCYDPRCAQDLQPLSQMLELSIEQIIELHASQHYQVVATGFAPGFAYLAQTAPELHLPRKPVPLTRIPPGSVAIAENQTVIYPKETPGGWHLIGCTKFELARVSDQGIYPALRVGQTVRFEPISFDTFCSGRR